MKFIWENFKLTRININEINNTLLVKHLAAKSKNPFYNQINRSKKKARKNVTTEAQLNFESF
jgi:hypothetical protein